MKRTVFFIAALVAASVNAQVLEQDNFDSYTIGNVTPDVTKEGQGGMSVYNGTVADYQIVSVDAAHGNSLQVSGGAGAALADIRYVYKYGVVGDNWASRTAGNNIITGQIDLYTGRVAGLHRFGSIIYDAAGAGIVGITYNTQTKTVNGVARLASQSSGAAGTYAITGLTAKTYPENTWIKLGYSYDTVNGVITYTIDGVSSTLAVSGYDIVKGMTPDEHDIYMPYLSGNTATYIAAADNVSIRASNTAILATQTVGATAVSELSIYPNPATDMITINSISKVNQVDVFDTAGKKVNVKLDANTVNVSSLPKGAYVMKITTAGSTEVKKFIKK